MLRFFTKKKPNAVVRRLYDAAVEQARLPIFYQTFGVADTLDGRFDMVVFHVWPVIDALRQDDGAISEDGQALFDAFVEDMEQNLRSIGVGDTTFPKKMKQIGKAFYGRFGAYREAGDDAALAAAIARNVLDDESLATSPKARALVRYARAMQEAAGTGDVLTAFRYPEPAAYAAIAEGETQ
ncbi:MAG: ubiquinol-cytochrome C chaperone family protein [Pseudomonadota bacterium]